MTGWHAVWTIAGMAVLTLVTRGLFVLPSRDLPFPGWIRQGLRYAPAAALAAVIAPEVLLSDGRLLADWADPRPYAAAAGAAWFFWRRSILGTIVSGSVVMVALRLGAGA